MIIDKLENCEFYYSLSEKFKIAFEYIKNNDFKNAQCGRYEIAKDIYCNLSEYQTKNKEDARFEAHKKYIDIQYVIDGEELMGYTNIENFQSDEGYNEEKDIVFGSAKGDFNLVKSGYFTVFTPNDAHMPSIKNEKSLYVKKVIVKIKID